MDPDQPSEPRAVLRAVFGHDDFRGGQAGAVEAVLAGRDAVVLLPTGAGKSVCYQVPALVARRRGLGATVVISPLIALMHDQVGALTGRGVAAAFINSSQDAAEQRAVARAFQAGELDLLYVSPERAALPSFQRMLGRTRVALLAIDEAHCLSQWGHDFRPEYLRLHELRAIARAPTIALTATATPRVMDEIVDQLALADPAIIRGDFSRPNLAFAVRHLRSDAARIEAVLAAAAEAGLRGPGATGRAIIYCSTRKKTESVAKALKAAGLAAGHYHAGRTALARERARRAFDLGRLRVLVATSAFGMGVDYPDVRLLVHFQAPGSLEAYYQEAGRAGRDGLPARCLLLFGPADLVTQRRLQSGGGAAAELRSEQALAAIERYAGEIECRQRMLCAHFTGTSDHPACALCDVCRDPEAAAEATCNDRPAAVFEPLPAAAVQIIVDAAGQLRKPVGKRNLAKALRGSRAKTVHATGLLDLPQHGALGEHSEEAICAAIDELVAGKTLERRGRKYPTVWLRGRPVREPGTTAHRSARSRESATPKHHRRPRHTDLARELDNYRRRMARSLDWKTYMVFQRRTLVAIDQARPRSRTDLSRIPGLGPAKIDRFGDDILDLVRRNP